MNPAFSTSPPVSTTMHGTSVRRAKPYCRSRVNPGRSATNASRVPVMALNNVDLPTFGRPISATTGSTRCITVLGGGVARNAARLPLSVSTTTVSFTATGGLLTRYLATRCRATRTPVFLSSQCK